MSPKAVRALAMAVFFGLGIPGMIVASINDNAGAAVTFGLIAAAAALALLAVTAVTTNRLAPRDLGGAPGAVTSGVPGDEAAAEQVEARVQRLVASGADETEVRDLVRAALRMARRSRLDTSVDR